MPNLFGYQTLGVPAPRGAILGGFVLLAIAAIIAVFIKDKVPAGLIAIILGAGTGLWLSMLVLKKLSRDFHVAAIAGLSGMSLDGVLSSLTDHLDTTITSVTNSVLKLAGVLGPLVRATISATGLGDPSSNIANTGTIAFLAIFLARLLYTLPDNPPSADAVASNQGNYSPEDRNKLAQAFRPAPPA